MDNQITILEGEDLRYFLDLLNHEGPRPTRLRIWQAEEGDGVKVKIDGGMWTPVLGGRDTRS